MRPKRAALYARVSTPTGRAMAGLLGVFAEFERELLRERIKAGIKQAKKNGKHCGRPRSAAKKSEQVVSLYRKKVSLSRIALKLGMSRSSARSWLTPVPGDKKKSQG